MKITQEVRDFAARQNASADTFLEAASYTPSSLKDGDQLQPTGGAAPADAEANKGMAEMSERFREQGGESYLPAGR